MADLGQKGFAGAWRTVQQHPRPGLALIIEEARKHQGQDDGLLKGSLGHIQPYHLVPLCHSSTGEVSKRQLRGTCSCTGAECD